MVTEPGDGPGPTTTRPLSISFHPAHAPHGVILPHNQRLRLRAVSHPPRALIPQTQGGPSHSVSFRDVTGLPDDATAQSHLELIQILKTALLTPYATSKRALEADSQGTSAEQRPPPHTHTCARVPKSIPKLDRPRAHLRGTNLASTFPLATSAFQVRRSPL